MLICHIVPKSEDSIIQLIQSLNAKKFRYFIDTQKNQVINFDDESSVTFFRTVRSLCTITAILNENCKAYPFVNDSLNNIFSGIVTELQNMEKKDITTALEVAKKLKNVFSEFSTSEEMRTINTNADSTTTVENKPVIKVPPVTNAEKHKVKSVSSVNSNNPKSASNINVAATKTKPVSRNNMQDSKTDTATPAKAKQPHVLDAIPNEIKHTMSEKEISLFPYVYKGIAAANSRKNKNCDKAKKIKAFLDTINFPTDENIVKLFYATEQVSSVTYKNIFATEYFAEATDFNTTAMLCEIRFVFKNWANQNCPELIEKNNLLSIVDILKLYKKFVE